jgi:hypothetical protein
MDRRVDEKHGFRTYRRRVFSRTPVTAANSSDDAHPSTVVLSAGKLVSGS